MLATLVVLFTAVPLAELMLILEVHKAAAGLWGDGLAFSLTGFTIFLTGVVGAAIARRQGLGILAKAQAALGQGEVPGGAFVEGVLVVVGGVLLLTPTNN